MEQPPAGWYPDASGGQRWWDGVQWTTHHHPAPTYVFPATNGMAVTALVCGLVGSILGLIPILFWAAWGLGATALVLGWIAFHRTRDPLVPRRGMAIWGLVLGLLAFGLGVWGYVIVTNTFNDIGTR